MPWTKWLEDWVSERFLKRPGQVNTTLQRKGTQPLSFLWFPELSSIPHQFLAGDILELPFPQTWPFSMAASFTETVPWQ